MRNRTRSLPLLVAGAPLVLVVPAAARVVGGAQAPAHAFGVGAFGPGCPVDPVPPREAFCTPNNYAFRVLAVSRGASQNAWGVFERRNLVTGGVFSGTVTCVNVNGNRAAIAGYLDAGPQFPGEPFAIWVEDNGTLGSGGPPDRVSHLVVLPPGDPDLAAVPAGFPSVCPATASLPGWFALMSGDITVEASPGTVSD